MGALRLLIVAPAFIDTPPTIAPPPVPFVRIMVTPMPVATLHVVHSKRDEVLVKSRSPSVIHTVRCPDAGGCRSTVYLFPIVRPAQIFTSVL